MAFDDDDNDFIKTVESLEAKITSSSINESKPAKNRLCRGKARKSSDYDDIDEIFGGCSPMTQKKPVSSWR